MYEIHRFYALRSGYDVICTGLTLEEAQEYCKDPNTSSRTAEGDMRALEAAVGPWFDGYEEE